MKRRVLLFAINIVFVWMASTLSTHILFNDDVSNNDVVFAIDAATANESFANLQDEIFTERFKEIYARMPLTYNQEVKKHIQQYLQLKHLTSKTIGLSEVYFPIFDQIFPEYGIPREVYALAIVESNLNNNAISPVGATGMWQIMKGTGTQLNLQINNLIDERKDTYKATYAAAEYLSQLHKKYDDWLLAIAAYNCGPGNVNKAIRRSGGNKNFWEIKKYLPRETRAYIPKLMAAIYITNYYNYHNIFAKWPGYNMDYSYDLLLHDNKSLYALAKEFGVNQADVKRLNPGIKNWSFSNLKTPIIIHMPITGTVIKEKDHWQKPMVETLQPLQPICADLSNTNNLFEIAKN